MACFWTDLIGVRESCDGGGGGGLPVDALIPLDDYFENAVWAASPLFEPAPYTYPPALVLSPTTIGMTQSGGVVDYCGDTVTGISLDGNSVVTDPTLMSRGACTTIGYSVSIPVEVADVSSHITGDYALVYNGHERTNIAGGPANAATTFMVDGTVRFVGSGLGIQDASFAVATFEGLGSENIYSGTPTGSDEAVTYRYASGPSVYDGVQLYLNFSVFRQTGTNGPSQFATDLELTYEVSPARHIAGVIKNARYYAVEAGEATAPTSFDVEEGELVGQDLYVTEQTDGVNPSSGYRIEMDSSVYLGGGYFAIYGDLEDVNDPGTTVARVKLYKQFFG